MEYFLIIVFVLGAYNAVRASWFIKAVKDCVKDGRVADFAENWKLYYKFWDWNPAHFLRKYKR